MMRDGEIGLDLARSGFVWHPGGLAQPDRAAAQGQPSMESVRAPHSSAPGLPCGSPWGRSAGCPTPVHPSRVTACLCRPSREACLPGEGASQQIDKIVCRDAGSNKVAATAIAAPMPGPVNPNFCCAC